MKIVDVGFYWPGNYNISFPSDNLISLKLDITLIVEKENIRSFPALGKLVLDKSITELLNTVRERIYNLKGMELD
jgi:hypothetical protein